ncbi:MAG: hypothetical protein LBG18_00555 [Mediterranea sp.]|jgi:hypothetical protein|nr:hypothetical protein [Mediterranea sp.]
MYRKPTSLGEGTMVTPTGNYGYSARELALPVKGTDGNNRYYKELKEDLKKRKGDKPVRFY